MVVIAVQAQLSLNEIVEVLRKTSKDTSVEDKLRGSMLRAQVAAGFVALLLTGTSALVSLNDVEWGRGEGGREGEVGPRRQRLDWGERQRWIGGGGGGGR